MSIQLSSTSDLVRVTTSTDADTDVHASWVDIVTATGATTIGRTNTATIAAATTTTVVGSPGAGTVRRVKHLTVRNKDATDTVAITLLHSDGTNVPQLVESSLRAGRTLQYEEGDGWSVRDSNARLIRRVDGIVTTASPLITNVILGADVVNNNASANTIADVTGLSFAVISGNTYRFRFLIAYTADATTTGSRWSINGPASPTLLMYRSVYSLTTTTITTNEGVSAYDTPAASNATSAATAANTAIIEGIITPSADGTVIARFASEVSGAAITAKLGSICQVNQVL